MKNTMKSFRNRVFAILTVLFLMIGSLQAQVFITDDEFEGNMRLGESEFVVPVPYQGGDLDEYLPLDGGWLLLGFGGAYLLRKRKKDKSNK